MGWSGSLCIDRLWQSGFSMVWFGSLCVESGRVVSAWDGLVIYV